MIAVCIVNAWLVLVQAQHHPWLNTSNPEKEGICDDAIANLKKFRQINYLKKLALELVARSLDTEQIRELEQCFLAVREFLFINALGW